MSQKFYDAGADGYDRLFGHVPRHFADPLLRTGHLVSGRRVLDIATGTGIAAEAAVKAVGPPGYVVVAADISSAMLEGQRTGRL
jgi:ubiquinone/menaquinone biosynthesis C-methylase UbiE